MNSKLQIIKLFLTHMLHAGKLELEARTEEINYLEFVRAVYGLVTPNHSTLVIS